MSPITRRSRLAATVAAAALGVAPVAIATTADAAPAAKPAPAAATKAIPKWWPTNIQLDLLAINDFHGNLETNKASSSSGYVLDGTTQVPAGGVAFLGAHLDRLRAEAKARKAHTVTVAAGDLIGASPLLSAAFHDEPTIEAMNAVGLQVLAVGNHEFDEGYRELLRMQRGGCLDDGAGANGQNSCPDPAHPFAGADFRYLAANVKYTNSGNTVFPAYQVRKVGTRKVAFIGMTLENTPNIVTKSGVEGLTFTDEVATVNKLIPRLQANGVKAIVVLLHEGGVPSVNNQPSGCTGVTGPGYDIAQALHPAVDVVVSGHTHAAYTCTVLDPAGQPRLFTSAASFGKLITRISVEIDRKTGDIIRPTATATNRIVTNTDPAVPARADLMSLIDRYKTLVAPIANEVIGRLVAGVTSVSRTPDADGESPAGNLIADSQLRDPSVIPAGGEAPVIAFMNPGGIRGDLAAEPDGDITYGAAFTVQPFNNYVTSITLTGEQIVKVLNEQWNGANEATTSRKILQVAGMSYTYSEAAAATTDPSVNAVVGAPMVDLDRDGTVETALDPTRSYRVVVNSFLVDGGDGFATLAQGTDRFFGGLDIDSLRLFLGDPANTPYTPGATDRIIKAP